MRKIILLAAILASFLASSGSSFAQTATLTATVRLNPLKVKVIAPSSVAVGQWFEIKASISNLGSEMITKTVAVITASSGLAIKGKKKHIGNLGQGETIVVWQAKANSSGNFVVQVEATGNLAGEEISASDSTVISAISSLARFWLRLIFGV